MVLPLLALLPQRADPVPALERFEFSAVHMAMPVRIVLYAPGAAMARTAAETAFQRIGDLEAIISDHHSESELRRLEHTVGSWAPVSADLFRVLSLAVEIAAATDGAFDPTIGPVSSLWRESRRTGILPPPQAQDSTRALVGWEGLRLDEDRLAVSLAREGMRLDLGGIGKGYILQEALAVLQNEGIRSAMIEAGGDIVVGDPPVGRAGWDIAVPGADSAFQARAAMLRNAALSTSAGSVQFIERSGIRYSHVLDPRTAEGMTHSNTVRVIAPDAATADALATALNVLAPEVRSAVLARFPSAMVSIHPDPGS